MLKENVVVANPSMHNSSCWKCGALQEDKLIFCQKCNIVQPPRSVNYFTRLGIEEIIFNIDREMLERRYFTLQQQIHPDFFTSKSKQEQQYAMEHSILLNEAYANLKDPIKRIETLLLLHGIILNEEQGGVKPNNEILMMVMERQEEISQATEQASLTLIINDIMQEERNLITEFSNLYDRQDLNKATQIAIHLKYLNKLLKDSKNKLMVLN